MPKKTEPAEGQVDLFSLSYDEDPFADLESDVKPSVVEQPEEVALELTDGDYDEDPFADLEEQAPLAGCDIQFLNGNIFDSTAQLLVNPVNCVGVMGKGLALQFKQKYPDHFSDYVSQCQNGEIQLGSVYGWVDHYTYSADGASVRTVVNFPTKRHWKDRSKLEDIVNGLRALKEFILLNHAKSAAIPALGCGNGGLEWLVVKEVIQSELQDLVGVSIEVYEPFADNLSEEVTEIVIDQSCAVSDCPHATAPGHFVCLMHWRLIPRTLQESLDACNRNPDEKLAAQCLRAIERCSNAMLTPGILESTDELELLREITRLVDSRLSVVQACPKGSAECARKSCKKLGCSLEKPDRDKLQEMTTVLYNRRYALLAGTKI